MRFWLCLSCFIVVAGCAEISASAQDPDKPLALLRQTARTNNYFITVQTNAKLPSSSKLSAILTNKSNLVTWEEDVKDCAVVMVGQFCKKFDNEQVVMNYGLAARPQPADKFRVSFAISDNTGRGSFRAVDLTTDFKSGGPRTDNLCKNGLIVDLQADNSALETNQTEKDYYESRLLALRNWLRLNESDPAKMATV